MKENNKHDLLTILDGISDGIVYLNREARYLSINKAAAEIFGRLDRDPKGMIGKSVWEVFPEVKSTVVEKETKRALENGVPIQYEFLYPVNQHLYEVQGYPSPEGVILVFRDITNRKA